MQDVCVEQDVCFVCECVRMLHQNLSKARTLAAVQ